MDHLQLRLCPLLYTEDNFGQTFIFTLVIPRQYSLVLREPERGPEAPKMSVFKIPGEEFEAGEMRRNEAA